MIFSKIFFIKRIISQIEKEASCRSLPDLISYIKVESKELARGGPDVKMFFIRYWPLLKLLNRNAHRQPCFYRSMVLLAYESSAGNNVEVNIGMSIAENHYSDGHCWLSKKGEKIYATNDIIAKQFIVPFFESNGITYWLEEAVMSEKKIKKFFNFNSSQTLD